MKLNDVLSGRPRPSLFFRNRNKMSKNAHESQVGVVISTVGLTAAFSLYFDNLFCWCN